VKGKLANRVGTLHTTSEHGVSSITTADAHTSAASNRPNWCPRWFKRTRPFRRKTKFSICVCVVTFQLAFTSGISWGLRWPVRMADNLTTFMCRLSWNLGASTCWHHKGLSRGLLYLYLANRKWSNNDALKYLTGLDHDMHYYNLVRNEPWTLSLW